MVREVPSMESPGLSAAVMPSLEKLMLTPSSAESAEAESVFAAPEAS